MALALAATFVVSPAALTRDLNGPFKRNAELIRERVADEEPLPYFGRRYWEHANPLLYYAERRLATPAPDADAAVAAALNHPSRLLLCDRDLLADLAAAGRSGRTVVEGARWVLLDLSPLSEEQST